MGVANERPSESAHASKMVSGMQRDHPAAIWEHLMDFSELSALAKGAPGRGIGDMPAVLATHRESHRR